MSDEFVQNLAFRLAELERKVDHLLAHAPNVPAPPPPTDAPSDNVRRLKAEGKLIHAIKLYRSETGCDLATAKARVEAL